MNVGTNDGVGAGPLGLTAGVGTGDGFGAGGRGLTFGFGAGAGLYFKYLVWRVPLVGLAIAFLPLDAYYQLCVYATSLLALRSLLRFPTLQYRILFLCPLNYRLPAAAGLSHLALKRCVRTRR